MATAEEDARTQELNFILKSLGERGKEGEIWKEFTEHTVCYLLQKFPEFLSKTLGKENINCIMLRPYGSAVEDLKILAPDDIGDLDIVIISTSEDLMIHDELIEYLPQHPMHVRIKGRDHPLLQSCLAEDTPYLATSAIKNFHPVIYGSSAPQMINYLTLAIQTASREKWGQIVDAEWKNKEARPALQVNCTHSFGPISGELEMAKNPQNLTNVDPAEWEWLFHSLSITAGLEYTRELAEILDEYMKFGNDLQISWHEKGLLGQPQTVHGFVQDLISSERFKQLSARVNQIKHTRNESERSGECLAEAEEHSNEESVTPGNCHEYKTGSEKEQVLLETFPSINGSLLTSENAHDSDKTAEEFSTTLCQSTMTPGEMSESSSQSSSHTMSKKGSEEKREREKNEGPDDSESESNTEQQPFADNGEPSYTDFKSLSSKPDFLLEHLFRPLSQESNVLKGADAKGTYKAPIAGGLDLVPALRCPGWPHVARDWIKRERKWPSRDVIDKIVQKGFHVVVKPPKNGGNPECDFRISFSHAEYLLSQEMNDIPRECYRCLKKFHRAYLKDPEGLVTFHLKNLLLQTIEETGPKIWTESNRVKCVVKLFGNLFQALRKKELPHFFVRSYNLFCVDYIDDPKILDVLARKVEKIVGNLMQSAKELIQKEAFAIQAQLEEEKSIFSTQTAVKTAPEDGFEKQEASSPSESHMVLPGTVKKDDTRPVSSPRPIYRFHYLKDVYLATSQELTTMAFNADDHTIESLDPLEKSLVGDLKVMIKHHNFDDAEFRRMFETSWNTIYLKVWLNPEPNMRRRMLDGIQGVVETWKYLLKQEDFAPENVEALAERLLNPDAEDPFDFSNLCPAGIGTHVVSRFLNSLTPSSAQTHEVNLDEDIPLD